ncbi:hypothetical protein Vadar_015912 [Vaccinium darrowii]|uniref:Uncharacterized protein n=1 Tax=Vaccinium darrowii TaxID=229202 RepID=A0ACB7Z446_9ERIC|nr:hypothetical protein Vadar_015912 [Vaccinium darrowii]
MGRKKGVVFDEGAPDDFDPENPYKDPVAMLEMREHIAGARTTVPFLFTVLRLRRLRLSNFFQVTEISCLVDE